MQNKKLLCLSLSVLLSFLSFPAISSATTTVNVNPGAATYAPPFQFWADYPYAPVPTPNDKVDLNLLGCPGASDQVAGCAVPRGFWNKKNPTIWIRPDKLGTDVASIIWARTVFYHELGHVFDYTHLNDVERGQIVQMLGLPAGFSWYGDSTSRPNEIFAEAAASCWSGPVKAFNAYGYSYNYQEIQPLCRAMTGAYKDDNSWFGQRVIRAKRISRDIRAKVVTRGPAVQWGGNFVTVYYKNTWQEIFACSGEARFGKQGSVKFDLCGANLKTRSTLRTGYFKINYWDIPRQATRASASSLIPSKSVGAARVAY